MSELRDLRFFVAAARHGGFRGAARATSTSASSISEAVRRLEERLGVRLLNRTTRSVALTEAGADLLDRIVPALDGLDSALDAASGFADGPRGVLRLNVPGAVTRTILPPILEAFLAEYPDVTLDLTADDGLVDILAYGADAGIRYEETLAQDMIAVPIGPRVQRIATAAAPGYLAAHGTPRHPRDLTAHDCIRTKFPSGTVAVWEFERNGEVVRLDPRRGSRSARRRSSWRYPRPSRGSALSPASRTGCARCWMTDGSFRCWRSGGHPSQAPCSITPVVVTCRRHCVPSSIL